MATHTTIASGRWSQAGTWDANGVPVDNGVVVIAAGHSIEVDVDQSGWANGMAGLTITSHATTPGMIYASSTYDGYLKVKAGTDIQGTNAATKGRILANSNGTWGGTGVLAWPRKFVIALTTTARLLGTYLDIALYCDEPTVKYLETYKTTATVTFQNNGSNKLQCNWTGHGLATGEPVSFRGANLPSNIVQDQPFVITSVGTNAFVLAYCNNTGYQVPYVDSGSGTITGYSGHSNTATGVMNVLTDVTANAQWTDAGAVVTLVDCYVRQASRDVQHNLTLSAITASTVTLSANVDSAQAPLAKIWLVTRNVAIRSTQSTSTSYVIEYASSATHGGTFYCEVRSTLASPTAYGLVYGVGHIMGGIWMGWNYVFAYATGISFVGLAIAPATFAFRSCNPNITGIVSGASYQFQSVSGATIESSAILEGASTGATQATNMLMGGTMRGVVTGFTLCDGVVFTGTLRGSTVPFVSSTVTIMPGAVVVAGTLTSTIPRFVDFLVVTSASTYTSKVLVKGGVTRGVDNGISMYRNQAYGGRGLAYQCVMYEDYLDTFGAHVTQWAYGDVTKNTTELRTSGAASSLQVDPLSQCGGLPSQVVPVLEWTELDVPASSQTRSVYIKGSGWAGGDWPEDEELWLEVEYYNSGSTLLRQIDRSTTHLDTGGAWTQYSVTFTPGRVGPVKYRVFLAKYYAGAKIYVDNMLVKG